MYQRIIITTAADSAGALDHLEVLLPLPLPLCSRCRLLPGMPPRGRRCR